MRKTFFFAILITLVLLLSRYVHAEVTETSSADPAIPERSGLYNEPKHPKVKVRVFVHKPQHGGGGGSSSLVCSLADPDSPTTVAAAGWHLPPSWAYNLNPSSVPTSVGSTNLTTIANNGFSAWSSATGGKVSFGPGADTTATRSAYDGQNIIAWGRTQGTALGVTYIRYDTSTGLALDVDTIMNKKFAWMWSGGNATCAYSNAYDAQDILTHEQGHWVGMDDMYDAAFQDATMYGYGAKTEVKKDTLTTGDSTGVFNIYNP